jgi:hypothetical protein
MANELKQVDPQDRSRRRKILNMLAGLLILALLAGAAMLYTGISTSLQAEENLHATLFTIRLVEQFVHERGHWPRSWSQLEELKFDAGAPSPSNGRSAAVRIGGSHGYSWPEQALHLQSCVGIDFTANVDEIIKQDPMQFDAIRPDGPHYEYRDYGFVESLQETLKSVAATD